MQKLYSGFTNLYFLYNKRRPVLHAYITGKIEWLSTKSTLHTLQLGLDCHESTSSQDKDKKISQKCLMNFKLW